jgi:phenylalanyl-tRNA synthetase alpha chain
MSSLAEVRAIRDEALRAIDAAADPAAVEAVRIEWLGRKSGRITALLRSIPSVAPEERAAFGQAVNALKNEVTASLEARQAALEARPAAGKRVDVTMPGRPVPLGRLHPVTRAMREMCDLFGRLGFEVVEGPEVEDEWHNFVALNIPAAHPARDPLDNFYIDPQRMLRSQTSTVQIRVMETQKPPIRIIAPGRVYRPDTVDATHGVMFHQIEGLYVDEGVTMSDLKTCLDQFAKAYFGPEISARLIPSYFPFTEPSGQVDISCPFCQGRKCAICKQTGWIELGGCGMVDPNVFDAVGYDSQKYTGFAFGMGIERMVMAKHGIPDLRLLFENDVRFLRQF